MIDDLWTSIQEFEDPTPTDYSKEPQAIIVPSDIGASSMLGNDGVAKADHIHKGVTNITVSSSYLFGEITLQGDDNISITSVESTRVVTVALDSDIEVDSIIADNGVFGDVDITGILRVNEIRPQTDSPAETIEISGDLTLGGTLRVDSIGSASDSPSGNIEFTDNIYFDNAIGVFWADTGGAYDNSIVFNASDRMVFEVNNVNRVQLTEGNEFVYWSTTDPFEIAPTTNSTSSLRFTQADLATTVMSIDTTNARVGVRTLTPGVELDINGDLTARGGDFVLGSALSVAADIELHADGTGSTVGPNIRLNVPEDYIADVNYYDINIDEDDIVMSLTDLGIGSTTLLEFRGGDSEWFSNRVWNFGLDILVDGTLYTDFIRSFDNSPSGVTVLDIFRCGDVTNGYTEFEEDGTMRMEGDAVVWNDINFNSGQSNTPSASAPPIATFDDNLGADTDIATVGYSVGDKQGFVTEYLHDCKENGDIYFHVHWQGDDAPAGGTDNVQWQVDYTVTRDGETCAPVTTITAESAITAQYSQIRATFAVISGSGIFIGSQIKMKLSRIAASADEYGGAAKLCTFGVHVEKDTIGSRQVSTK